MPAFEPRPWRLLGKDCVADCRIFKVMRSRFRHPDGRESDFFTMDTSDWVQAAAIVGQDRVLMVNQFRFGSLGTSWEFPGGVMEPGESPIEAARRELAEETGYEGGEARIIAEVSPNPAIQSNKAYIVLIDGCRKTGKTAWDPNEELEVREVPVEDIDGMVENGEIHHSIALNCVLFLQRYLEGSRGEL